ncbi:MAG: ATP-binding cassette domain-containing protein [Phycisphaerales bacterium]
MSDAIIIEGVTKTFGPKLAVENLSLRVPRGSLTGVIGPNGAGKTTTIRMIMSIIFPDRGTLEVLGKKSAIESKDLIGYLPEERGLYRKMKVGAFLMYLAQLKGIDSGAAKKKAAEWLARVGLADVSKKKCEELSKGMQQKVQFIAAVIHEPQLLILDEVFSGLDPVNRLLMRELIDDQHRRGCTILFSTHGMHEAEQLCNHVLMIHRGRKVLDGSLRSILSRFDHHSLAVETVDPAGESLLARVEGVKSVRPGSESNPLCEVMLADGVDATDALRRIVTAVPVRRIEQKRPTLEDVFIELVMGGTAGGGGQGSEVDREKLRAQLATAGTEDFSS